MAEVDLVLGKIILFSEVAFHSPQFFSPICVAKHLAPFLPSHPTMPEIGAQAIDAVSAAPFGSASITLISWAYIKMLGGKGLVESSKIALLNANYMASRLQGHYSLRYKNENGRVAHELLIDLAEFDKAVGLKVTDFAKRLQVCRLRYPLAFNNNISFRTMVSILQHVLGQFRPVCLLNPPSPKLWMNLIGQI